jgi:protease YdgD
LRIGAAVLAVALSVAAAAHAADRRVVVDPNAPPWNAIAKVQTNIGTRCTGVLIAPAVVLTAAHCLYNRRTGALLQPLSLHVLFGYERAGYRWHRLVARVVTGAGFDGAGARPQAADWARLELAEAVPLAPLPLFDGPVAAGQELALAGYNQDRAQLLMADRGCHVRRAAPLPGGAMFVVHDCAGTRGTSGGPLLAKAEQGWQVLGINIAAGTNANLALAGKFQD